MEYLFIYGLQMADFIVLFKIITVLGALLFAIGLIPTYLIANDTRWNTEEECNAARKAFDTLKKLSIKFSCALIILGFIPTEQTLLLMGGTYLGKKAVNEVVQSDKMEKINTIIDLQLDKYIKDLQGATK